MIGNYHPHGDSSVYEAMVRLSQDWKVRNVLVEMHGNNGSIDADPPAAMRYTEARLAKIAQELLRDIEKETVDFIPNFDETSEEPVVLPARFPNLLVNGSTGISSGYATDIPPHNLAEVIDGVIKKIDKPNLSLDELMKVIKGPDFPTGGIIQGIDEIKKAYKTGRGKIVVRGKAEIETLRGGREQIVITEIPYEVNKAHMVKKFDELRIDRKVEGIAEVRDETDRTGLRVVIELKKEVDSQGILNYLYKNTDLQINYHFNMVAIQNNTPKLLSLPEIIDSYINHQKEVSTRQAQFELRKAKDRSHIVEGLIKAISVLDEVIALIRASKNKKDAKQKLISSFDFSEPQAEAIVMLQLYRLTNTDVVTLEKEAEELRDTIKKLELVLEDEKELMKWIKKGLREIKKNFKDDRRTVIEEEVEELSIDIDVLVASEDVLVSITKDGYIKRTSLRSYSASDPEDISIKDRDYLLGLYEINTTDRLLLFTSKGKYISFLVHELPDIRWKDIGQHLSNLATFDKDERIIKAIPVRKFGEQHYFTFFTKNGMIKRTEMNQYEAQRHGQSLIAIHLKEDDEVVNVELTNGNDNILIASTKGYGLWFDESEVNVVGTRASGVKAIQLKEDEQVVHSVVFQEGEKPDLFIVTNRGSCKRMAISELEKSSRAKRGLMMLRHVKSKPHQIKGLFTVGKEEEISCLSSEGNTYILSPLDYPKSDRTNNGSFFIDSQSEEEVHDVWKKVVYTVCFDQDTSK